MASNNNSGRSSMVAQGGIWDGLHPGMGIAAKGMVLAFVVFTALNVDFANGIYSAIRSWIESALNWYYISAVTIMLFVCFYLMFSRFGAIKLGDDDSKPEFSNFSWFAMLFSAGVGIGLLFFGIAEPMFYFDNTQPWGYPNNPFADHLGITEMTEQRVFVWPTLAIGRNCLSRYVRRFTRLSASEFMAPSATPLISWPYSARCLVSRPRSASV